MADVDPAENTRTWLAAQHRDQFIVGDDPPPDVQTEMHALLRTYRRAMGFPLAGFRPTAADYNKALDWHEHRAICVDDLAMLDWPEDAPKDGE
jgi:hypothetical protein